MLRRARQALRDGRRPRRPRPRPVTRRARRRRASTPRRRPVTSTTRWRALRGEVELPIPAASAVKIDGERAYKLARRGVAVEMPLRRSTVHALELVIARMPTARPSALGLHVSSGTYVRAIAQALGGHCTSLRRTAIGPFEIAEAAPVDEVELLPVARRARPAPPEALDRVPDSVRAGVLALASERWRAHAATSSPSPRAARGRDRHLRRRPPRPPRRHPGRCRRRPDGRPSSRSTRTRGRCSGTRSSCSRRSSGGSSCSAECGVEDVLVVEFTPELSPRLTPAEFARALPARDRHASRGRRDGLPLRAAARGRRRPAARARLRRAEVPLVENVSSTAHPAARACRRVRGRSRSCSAARSRSTAPSSSGDHRGGTLGFPTANLRVDARPARARRTGSTPAPPAASAPRSRSASTRTTAAPSAGSRPTCSTGRATSTATGSCSSSGGGCATSGPSRAKPTWSPRSPATSRRPGRRPGRR